jgi:adenosylcobinamide-phosphate synthase
MNAVPALAVALDRVAGEPPGRLHPVVVMGRYCAWAGALMAGISGARRQVAAGGIATAVGAVAAAVAGAALRWWLDRLPRPLALAAEAAVLSTLLSARMLEREVLRVHAALGGDDTDEPCELAAARRAVAGLVSRDVSALDTGGIREAALESLAENASDAIVAPLWWFAVAGLPAAAAYRFVNTADAMWGYRTGAWEWRGKAAAHADDLANWWPARLTALLLAPRVGVARVSRTADVTASPNAGWPMGALALRLDVRLRKLHGPAAYTLHPRGRPTRADDVGPAIRAVRWATIAASAVATLVARTPR